MLPLQPTSEAMYAGMFYGTDAARIFSPYAAFALMVQVEAALSAALEEAGIAPAGTGSATRAACPLPAHGDPIAWLDADAICSEADAAGNLAIPFVKHLTTHVRAAAPDAVAFVHFGATSQDLLDTVLVLQLREATTLMDTRLAALTAALVTLAQKHRKSMVAGRTWLQQGPPTTLGLKAAGWLAAVMRQRKRLREARTTCLMLQFGGAVGTLASLGVDGDRVAHALARALELPCPELPWHTHRDGLTALAAVFANITGTLGKIARDISLLMQTEVAEAFEPAAAGKGGSSTMPHKRNPVACACLLAAATRTPNLVATLFAAMPQEHERGLGGWHAEWQTLPELTMLTLGALGHAVPLLEGLEVDAERMRSNLDITRGYAMGESVVAHLAPTMGRLPAHHLVERLTREAIAQDQPLHDVLKADPTICQHLSPAGLLAALDAADYLGSAQIFIDRVLRAAESEPS